MVNPFKPGAGHMPPYLAGRDYERHEFERLLGQQTILENLVLTGLRGLGKTVLLETFKPMAIGCGWLWAGTDLSEATSISDENLALRILTDIAVVTSSIVIDVQKRPAIGFGSLPLEVEITLNFNTLIEIYHATPGLVADKLKSVLLAVWSSLQGSGKRGVVFAYDESQNLSDHSARHEYPLSLLLDVFQSIQRQGVPFLLALTGLPTLFPKLVGARTFAERMFRVVSLDPLSRDETGDAISRPTENHPVRFTTESVDLVWKITRGYPYFVQYVCREAYDGWVQSADQGFLPASIPVEEILRKLDTDFFAGRWAKATDRQRHLMAIIAKLPNQDGEFTVQEIVEHPANQIQSPAFTRSYANQMLAKLADAGLIYKTRHGRYCFAVPLLGDFIRRQERTP